jgi:transposase
MNQAGKDMLSILDWSRSLGESVQKAKPILLLERVWNEQFQDGSRRVSVPAGAVQNPHDPEAQWSTKNTLKKKEWVGYKTQICETAEQSSPGEPTRQVITAIITQPAITSDQASLKPVLKAHGELPSSAFTDAGYNSGKALAEAHEEGMDLIAPALPSHQRGERYNADDFDFDMEKRSARCPNGVQSTQCSRIDEANRAIVYRFEWPKKACQTCLLAKQCVGKNQKHRTIVVGEHHHWVQQRRREMKTEAFRALLKTRNAIEGTVSECKRAYGLNRARYRGLKKVNLQALMTAAACNLRRWSTRLLWEATRPIPA